MTAVNCCGITCDKRFRTQSDLDAHDCAENTNAQVLCAACRQLMDEDVLEAWYDGFDPVKRVEDALEEYDPTPYCTGCGAGRRLDCTCPVAPAGMERND